MPDKLDRCVSDVKAKGDVKNPWAVCKSSVGKETKVNQNRIDPYPSPDIKKGKVEPIINKTPKRIGGEKKRQREAILYKQILDTKLRQNARSRT